MIFFVIMEYIAHKKGVIIANKYPMKFGDSGVRFVKSPPVIKKNPPIVASKKPIIFIEFNFSLKKVKAKMVIITGAKRHTINAGREEPIISMALYWARKNTETPVKLEKIIKIQSFLENLVGDEVATFCYPFGRFDDFVMNSVISAGYKFAIASIHYKKSNSKKLFSIRRFNIYAHDSKKNFLKKLNMNFHSRLAYRDFIYQLGGRATIIYQKWDQKRGSSMR